MRTCTILSMMYMCRMFRGVLRGEQLGPEVQNLKFPGLGSRELRGEMLGLEAQCLKLLGLGLVESMPGGSLQL
ncbi:hypothetical protein EF849_21625 [Aeromonas jandaei]|nr:hypothetical protein [Aeromonas jandaei]